MDKDTFLMQLAWLVAHGATTIKKQGSTFVLESAGTDSAGQRHKLHLVRGSVPWFDQLYKRAKKL